MLECEGLWLAAFDLVCICGFVTGAVMDRALTDKYHCRGWLTRAEGDLDTPSVIARAAVEAKAESELWPESSECAPLRGVFGIAISQWFVAYPSCPSPAQNSIKADYWAWGQCYVGGQLPAGLFCAAGT